MIIIISGIVFIIIIVLITIVPAIDIVRNVFIVRLLKGDKKKFFLLGCYYWGFVCSCGLNLMKLILLHRPPPPYTLRHGKAGGTKTPATRTLYIRT